MDPKTQQAIALLQQAVSLLSGSQSAGSPVPPPPASAAHRRPPTANFDGSIWQLPFGKYKGYTLPQVLDFDTSYLGWVRDKFGINKDGTPEDPQYVERNSQVRSFAAFLLAPAPVAPVAAPAPAPMEAPVADLGSPEIPF